MKTININRTDYTDAEIIAAVEDAENHGKQPVLDNDGIDGPVWQRICYKMTIGMDNGDEIVVVWKPTEQGYADAEKYDDESCMCDWDDIAEVHYGLLHYRYIAQRDAE